MKKLTQLFTSRPKLLLALAVVGAAVVIARQRNRQAVFRPIVDEESEEALALARAKLNETELATRHYMLSFVVPLWIGAGLLDWYWHRKTKIETTSGTKESIIHAMMMSEAGVAVMAGLFLEVNAGVLLLMLSAFGIHELTAFWDVAYASEHRDVRPREQHTHSLLEMLPFCAVSFMIIMHWDQFLALFGDKRKPARFALEWKKVPLPPAYIRTILAAITGGIALPYGEELVRCWQAEQKGLVGVDTPLYVRERVAEQKALAA